MNIACFPNPVLREKSKRIKNITPEINGFISRLKETMYTNKGCVGIAAPQAGKPLRIALVDVTGHPKAKKSRGLITLINPRITQKSGKTISREGCLSVPDFTGNVKRFKKIIVGYIDEKGKKKVLAASGFEAVVIQHEVDHLDGILFIDRISNSKRDLFPRKTY